MCTNAFGDVPIGLSLSYRTNAEYKMWFWKLAINFWYADNQFQLSKKFIISGPTVPKGPFLNNIFR